MEANENPLSPYYHLQQQQHHHHHQSPTTASTTATIFTSSTNGLLPSALHMSSPATATTTDTGPHMLYPHSAPSAAVSQSPLESVRRKRGRPRKYGTPEEALAAKKAATASAHSSTSREKKHRGSSFAPSASSFSESSKKSQLGALGNAGQGFTPHVLNVAAGEDVGQKIMLFMQQSKREMCVLSASGSISNAALRQPATSGGNIAYEGRFEIISLSGSYVRTELGGRTGGLSVCLSSADGQIVGGGVGGPLKALGPVQVIVGTFQMDSKKEAISGAISGAKGDAAVSKLPSIGGLSGSNLGYRSTIEPSGRNPVRGNDDDHQVMGGSHFILQPHAVHFSSRTPDWRNSSDPTATAGYELAGRVGRGANQSRENGDYDQIPD